jgi:gamma-glutamyltranspeptidase/glutathione hydrolase
MYFAMAVTLPSAASLGASGVCIVHDAKSRAGEAFVFGPVSAPGGIRGVPITVPSGVRAVTLMHVRHGQVRWEATVAPAERLARLGVPVSRALSRDLQAGAVALGADSEARRIFGKGSGIAVTEGDNFTQTDLAATLGILRQRGGVDLSQGALARLVSEQIAQLGGSMPLETIRNTIPQAAPPAGESYGGFRVYVAPAPMAGPARSPGGRGSPEAAARRPVDSGGIAGLAAIDEKGNAAACSLSMGQLFGARIVVPGTGILLGTPTADSNAVSPLVIGNPGNGEVLFAGAGGGSPSAAYATGFIARGTVQDKQYVAAALKAHAGRGGYVNAIAVPRRHQERRRELQQRYRSGRQRPGAERHDALTQAMSRSVSRRAGAVDPFIVMDVMAAAAEKEAAGDTVIHLEVGQPSTPAPKAALAAAHAALDTDRIGYVAALGMPVLRERIARHYRDTLRRRGVAREGDRHDRIFRRISARLPRQLRCRRQGGARGAGLSGLSQHPGRPQSRSRRSADLRSRSLPADGCRARESGADRRPYRGEPIQSDGDDGEPLRS